MNAPPGTFAQFHGLECRDADGDALTYTAAADPAGVAAPDGPVYLTWNEVLFLPTRTACEIEAIRPALESR